MISPMERTKKQSGYDLKYIHKIYETMIQQKLSYVYQGSFNNDITDKVLGFCEEHIEKSGEDSKIKKKLYFIMVECLQNITRHQNESKIDDINHPSALFMVRKNKDKYSIISGNLMESKHIESLTGKLNRVNENDKD